MPDHVTQEAVYLPGAACQRVELAAHHLRGARPSCKDERSRGRRSHQEEVEGCFRTGDRWEWVVDFVVEAPQ